MNGIKTSLALVLIILGIGLPGLGSAYLFDWDEANFAECAREMLVTGDWLHPRIDYDPFWEKPPLFFWLQAIAMHLFGINEFAARFPNVLVGIATVLLLYHFGKRWIDNAFGLLWALLWIGSLLPQFYMHSGLIDPLFNILMFGSMVGLLAGLESARARAWLILAGVLLGLAILTKGPIAILLVGIPSMIVWSRRFSLRRLIVDALLVLVISIIPFTVWLMADQSQYGQWFMQSFLNYQLRLLTTGDAGHSGPFYYHVIVLLLGCFPASFLALGMLRGRKQHIVLHNQSIALLVMLIIVVLIFSIVQTKIVHYSSLAYYPITFFAAQYLHGWWQKPSKKLVITYAVGTSILATLMLATPLMLQNKPFLQSLVKDEFARAIITSSQVHWNGYEWIAGALVAAIVAITIIVARSRPHVAMAMLLLGHALGISSFIRLIAPRIQDYTQRAVVELCQSYVGRDVIIEPIGYKTYLHLFYTKRPPKLSPGSLGIERAQWSNFLLSCSAPVDAIFIAKQTKANDIVTRYNLVIMSRSTEAWLFALCPHKQ